MIDKLINNSILKDRSRVIYLININYNMNQYKRRSHNQSVDVRIMNSSIN